MARRGRTSHRSHAGTRLRGEHRDRHVRPPRHDHVEHRGEARSARSQIRIGEQPDVGRREPVQRTFHALRPCPRGLGIRSTVAPAVSAAAEVASDEPSSTTTTSSRGRPRSAATVCATVSSSSRAGTKATTLRPIALSSRRWKQPRDAVLHAVVPAGAVREGIAEPQHHAPTRRSAGRRCRRSRAARRTSRPRSNGAPRRIRRRTRDSPPLPSTTPSRNEIGHERLHERSPRSGSARRRSRHPSTTTIWPRPPMSFSVESEMSGADEVRNPCDSISPRTSGRPDQVAVGSVRESPSERPGGLGRQFDRRRGGGQPQQRRAGRAAPRATPPTSSDAR